MESRVYEFVFRGVGDFDNVQQELEELLAINVRLQNQHLENAKKSREEATARKQLADEAKQAALSQIQSELGVSRAMDAQKGIIEELRARIKLLKQGREQANDVASINKYTEAMKISQKQLNDLTGATDKFKGSNGFWRDMQGWVVGALAVDRLTEWGTTLVTNEGKLEAQRTALQNVIKSNSDYQNSIAFLTKLSNDYGQDLLAITKTYTSFIASSESSNLSLKERNRIYESIVKAGSTLKLSNEEIEGSLRAVSQMFSKGNVQAEELRGQLGERLPGAFGLAAKAMGVSEQKLNDMLKAGKVLAVDLLPKLATELENTFGKGAASNLEMIGGSQNYLNNKVILYFDTINKNYGITQKIASAFRFLGDNIESVVDTVGIGIKTWIAYEVATRASASASLIWNGITKAGNIIRGEYIIGTQLMTGMNIANTESLIASKVAAQTFNTTMASNPFGIVALAIGTLIGLYQTFKSETEDLQALTLTGISLNDEDIKGLTSKKAEINAVVSSLANLKEGSEGYKFQVKKLISQYPEYFGKLDAEKSKYIDIQIALKLANAELERKIRLMANEKLVAKVADKVAETQLQIAQEEVAYATRTTNQLNFIDGFTKNLVGANNYEKGITKGHLDKMAELKKTADNDNLLLQKVTQDKSNEEYRQYTQRFSELRIRFKTGDIKTQKEFNEETKKLNDEFYGHEEKKEKAITNLGKGEDEKRKKEKIDSMKTLALIQEKTRIAELEKSEVQEQKLLAIDKDIAIQRINDSKDSSAKKTAEILKIEQKFRIDLSNLTDKYDETEKKDEKKKADERIKLKKAVTDFFSNIAKEQTEKAIAEKNKEHKEVLKLENENLKKSLDLLSKQFELKDKLRVFDRIRHAQTIEEIAKIEQEENEKALRDNIKKSERKIAVEQILYANTVKLLGAGSSEAIKQNGVVLDSKKDVVLSQIELEEFLTRKYVEELKERQQLSAKAGAFIIETVNQMAGVIDKELDESFNKTTSLVQKAVITNQKQALSIAKQGVSAIVSFASGDIGGAVMQSIGLIFNGIDLIVNASKRKAEAAIQQSRETIQTYLDFIQSDIDTFIESLGGLKDIYGEIGLGTFEIANGFDGILDSINKIVNAGPEIQSIFDIKINTNINDIFEAEQVANDLKGIYGVIENAQKRFGYSIADLINAETKRGEKILENYNESVKAENATYSLSISNENASNELKIKNQNQIFDDKIKDINDIFNEEISKINAKYDYETLKANQKYSQETTAILAAGSAQLEALITNENSLSSVRAEFAAKRLEVEQAFPLASKAITADMTQSEIDAINASIKARDDQFAKIQSWYNDELTFIVNSEGQKRKEYTATELIQKGIAKNLETASIKFQADEIVRNKEKQDAIVKAESDKTIAIEETTKKNKVALELIETTHKVALELIETTHKDNLTKLHNKYIDDITLSYKVLTTLLEAQAKQIEEALASAAQKGTEEYIKLEQQLNRVKSALEAIGSLAGAEILKTLDVNTPVITPNSPIGFANGTERLPNLSGRSGIDTELIKADVGERIMQTNVNNRLKSFFGRDLSNNELAFKAMSSTMPSMNYEMLANLNNNANFTDGKALLGEFKGLRKDFKNLKQVNVDVRNGHPTVTERSSNRMIIYS